MIKSKKILIMGAPASGKTSLAKRISKSMNIPHIEIDKIYWKNVKGKDINPFFKKELTSIIQNKKNFVVEGHLKKCIDVLEHSITHVVFLKPNIFILLLRSLKRFWNTKNTTEIKMNFSLSMFLKREQLYQRLLKNGAYVLDYPQLKKELQW